MKRRSRAARLVSVKSWLLPTLIGPGLGALAFVVVHALVTGMGTGRVLVEVVASAAVAAVLTAVLSLVDIGLLLTRLRTPPTSTKAWLSSALAGACAALLWRLLRPSLLSAPSSHGLAVLAAVIVAAIAVRVLAGDRPSAWLRFS